MREPEMLTPTLETPPEADASEVEALAALDSLDLDETPNQEDPAGSVPGPEPLPEPVAEKAEPQVENQESKLEQEKKLILDEMVDEYNSLNLSEEDKASLEEKGRLVNEDVNEGKIILTSGGGNIGNAVSRELALNAKSGNTGESLAAAIAKTSWGEKFQTKLDGFAEERLAEEK